MSIGPTFRRHPLVGAALLGVILTAAPALADEVLVDIGGSKVRAKGGEVLVRYQPGTTSAELAKLAKTTGFAVTYESAYTNVAIFTITKKWSIEKALGKLSGKDKGGIILSAAPNAVVEGATKKWKATSVWNSVASLMDDYMTEAAVDADTASVADAYQYQWHLHHSGAATAWQAGYRGLDMGIAILDTGVAPNSHSLQNVAWDLAATFIPGTDTAYDDNGHGTHMASVAASDGVVMGMAPDATIVPVKVLDQNKMGTEMSLVDGLYYAASLEQVHVISLSLTFPPGYVPSRILSEAIDEVAHQGLVIVAATGNDGVASVGYPAAFPEVIAVGAARMTQVEFLGNRLSRRAEYSNHGFGVDVLGFGGDLERDCDDDGVPDGILAESLGTPENPAGLTLTIGTSPAAAQVAGAAALLLEAGVHPTHIRSVLLARSVATDGDVAERLIDVADGLDADEETLEALAGSQDPNILVNPVLVFTSETAGASDCDDGCTCKVVVEVTDAEGNPLNKRLVGVTFSGDVIANKKSKTDAYGVAVVEVELPPGAGMVQARVAWVHDVDGVPFVPTLASRVDRLTYELFSNLGTGLASSSFVLQIDSSAWTTTNYVDSSTVMPTYLTRTWGTGLASSSLVLGFTQPFYLDSGLAQQTMLFTSWGTGLASSSIIIDEFWFRADLRESVYGTEDLFVRHYTVGSGLASSSIIWDEWYVPWNHFYVGTDPAILMVPTGSGLASSSLIWNRALLDPTLFFNGDLATWTAPTTGVGLASSSLVLDYSAFTVTTLGFDWASLTYQFPQGVGLASSSLVLWTNPMAYLTTSPIALMPIQLSGMNVDEPQTFVAPE